jgi:hypothetical protein
MSACVGPLWPSGGSKSLIRRELIMRIRHLRQGSNRGSKFKRQLRAFSITLCDSYDQASFFYFLCDSVDPSPHR